MKTKEHTIFITKGQYELFKEKNHFIHIELPKSIRYYINGSGYSIGDNVNIKKWDDVGKTASESTRIGVVKELRLKRAQNIDANILGSQVSFKNYFNKIIAIPEPVECCCNVYNVGSKDICSDCHGTGVKDYFICVYDNDFTCLVADMAVDRGLSFVINEDGKDCFWNNRPLRMVVNPPVNIVKVGILNEN